MTKTEERNGLKSAVVKQVKVVKQRISKFVWVFGSIALAALVIAVGLWALQVRSSSDPKSVPNAVAQTLNPKPPLEQLLAATLKDPKNAQAQWDLGSAYWDLGKKENALESWDAALAIEPRLANSGVAKKLVSCFGTSLQAASVAMILKRKVMESEPYLRYFAGDRRFSVRQNAVATLAKLGRVQKNDWVNMWIADTKEQSCDVRRRAIEKLGQFADKRAILAIREANQKDDEQTAWYQASCLRNRPEEAEKKIFARR